MSGIIRWLAPHLFPQLNAPNPVDASANAAGNWALSGAPGSVSPSAFSGLVNPNVPQNAALGMQPQSPPPTSYQGALNNTWQRYAGQGMPMQMPQNLPTPEHAAAAANAILGRASAAMPTRLPQFSAPPPAPPQLHPQSVRVDFHPPPEPELDQRTQALHTAGQLQTQSNGPLYFLHPGVGSSP